MVYYYVCYLVIICTNIFDTIIQNKIDYKRYASKRNFFKNIKKQLGFIFCAFYALQSYKVSTYSMYLGIQNELHIGT